MLDAEEVAGGGHRLGRSPLEECSPLEDYISTRNDQSG